MLDNGLFTYTEMDTGSDPCPEGFYPIGLWLQLYYEEMITLHTKGGRPLFLISYNVHFGDRMSPLNRDSRPSPCMWMSDNMREHVSREAVQR